MQLKCGLLSHFPSYIAADLGAGSGRVVAGQLVNEQLCLHEVTRFSTSFSEHPGSEYLSWGIVSIEEHVRQGIELAAMLAPVVSVGVDSWGVDYVLLDAELRRVGTAICYRDNRTLGMIGRVTARIPASDIYRRTGIQFQAFNTLYQLAAMADAGARVEPENPPSADDSRLLALPAVGRAVKRIHQCHDHAAVSTSMVNGISACLRPRD